MKWVLVFLVISQDFEPKIYRNWSRPGDGYYTREACLDVAHDRSRLPRVVVSAWCEPEPR